jgi:hypothetical protein
MRAVAAVFPLHESGLSAECHNGVPARQAAAYAAWPSWWNDRRGNSKTGRADIMETDPRHTSCKARLVAQRRSSASVAGRPVACDL